MLKYILLGGGFAFAAAVQPGPLMAFLLSRVALVGWRRTLPAAFAPVISDGPIAVLVLFVLHRVAGGFEQILKAAGGILLLYFAGNALAEWRRGKTGAGSKMPSGPQTLFQAVTVNLVNPGPYLGWSLVLGPLAMEAWRQSSGYAISLVASFYVSMVLSLALIILLFGTTSFLGAQGRRALLLASSAALASIGVYQLVTALEVFGQ
jgi:threonine/homoserine/homoserine lactone efflux protein